MFRPSTLLVGLGLLLLGALPQGEAQSWIAKPPPARPPPRRPPPRAAPTSYATLADLLLSSPKDYSTTLALLQTMPPGLMSQFTVTTMFLPNNDAWKLYWEVLGSVGNVTEFLALPPLMLQALLGYHVVPGVALMSTSLPPRANVPTALPGFNLTVTKGDQGVIYVTSAQSKAQVNRRDFKIGSGSVVHIVDRVLVPFDILNPPNFGTTPTPSGATPATPAPAPTGATPAASPAGATPAASPAGTTPAVAPSPDTTPAMPTRFSNFTEALGSIPGMATLGGLYAAAIGNPLISDTMKQLLTPPFTVLAPTDAAFAAYFAERNVTLQQLAAGNPVSIAMIIMPHLAFGQRLPAASLSDGQMFKTGVDFPGLLSSTTLSVDIEGGAVKFVGPKNTVTAVPPEYFAGAEGPTEITIHVVGDVIEA